MTRTWNNDDRTGKWGEQCRAQLRDLEAEVALPSPLPVIAATPSAQGIVDALIALGLVTQAT